MKNYGFDLKKLLKDPQITLDSRNRATSWQVSAVWICARQLPRAALTQWAFPTWSAKTTLTLSPMQFGLRGVLLLLSSPPPPPPPPIQLLLLLLLLSTRTTRVVGEVQRVAALSSRRRCTTAQRRGRQRCTPEQRRTESTQSSPYFGPSQQQL